MRAIRFSFILLSLLWASSLVRGQSNYPNGNNSLPAATDLTAAPGTYPQGTKVNWVRTHTITKPINTPSDIPTLMGGEDHLSTSYSDGLGRTIQTVAKGEGLGWADIILPVYYDSFGRQPSQRLPYSDAIGDGLFKRSAFPDAETYNSGKYAGEQAYYSATEYDDVTLYRAAKSMKPGAAGAGTHKGITSRVRLNRADEDVRVWEYVNGQLLSSLSAWGDATLYVTETIAQNGARARQYKDREGKMILTKREVSDTLAINPHAGWLCTYYVYDEMNHLRCVLSPKAVESAVPMSWSVSQAVQDNLCYTYDYDERGRVTRKKLPGRANELIVYDDANRPVLVQDGNLSAMGSQWMFTKYDALGRVVLSGKFLNSGALSQAAIINDLQSQSTANAFLSYLKTMVANAAYTTNISVPDAEVLAISFFDTYSAALTSAMPYCDAVVQSLPCAQNNMVPAHSMETMGMSTGNYIRIMHGTATTPNWEGAVSYYDTYGRLIQGQDINHKGGHDTVSMRYGFSGALLATLSSVANPASTTMPLLRTYSVLTYYGNGKLQSASQKINYEPYYRRINTFNYDEMGRVKQKLLGSTAETQNYTYRVWGALEAINKGYCQAGGSNFFGEIISYDNGFDSVNGAGLPSGLQWRLKGSGNTERAYGYLYDRAGRLTTGYYSQNNSGPGGWNNVVENYTATGMHYDANGNFTAMKQWGTKQGFGAPFEMDELCYDYNPQSNQLKAVTDTITQVYGLGEFKELIGPTATDYTYDNNGNAVQDVNRGISAISYDYHNKPVQILYASGDREIDFSYDAAGVLLTKKIIESGQADKTIDYLGGAEYADDNLSSLAHSEGRVRPVTITTGSASTTAFEYDFFVRDHAGNVRSLLTEAPDANWYNTMVDASTGRTNLTPVSYDPSVGGATLGYTMAARHYVVTSELNSAGTEEALFDKVAETRDSKPGSTSAGDQKDSRLNAAEGKIVGPSIMLRVMAGDTVGISTQALYVAADDTSHSSNATAEQLASALFTALSGGGAYQTLNESNIDPEFTYNGVTGSQFLTAMQELKNSATADGQHPQAFLNYILLDDNLNIATDQSGFVQTSIAGSWNPLNVPVMEMKHSGYLMVFLSNESRMNVHFDNLDILHYKGKLLEESHYYPYGLTITTKAFSGAAGNNTLYEGKKLQKEEFSDGTGLDWYDFSSRAYDPQMGMFHSYDPMGEGTPSLGAYQYCNNNPVVYSDPTGMKAQKLDQQSEAFFRAMGAAHMWDEPWSAQAGGGGSDGMNGNSANGSGSFNFGGSWKTGFGLGTFGGDDNSAGNGTALANFLNACWNAAGENTRTVFRFSDRHSAWGFWTTTKTTDGDGENTSRLGVDGNGIGLATQRITSRWSELDDVYSRASMHIVNSMETENSAYLEHAKLIGEITHNTVVLALGQGFEAAERAAPAAEIFGKGAKIMSRSAKTIVGVDMVLTTYDGLTDPKGWQAKNSYDLTADGIMLVPVVGEFFAVGWFIGNIISMHETGKGLSEIMQEHDEAHPIQINIKCFSCDNPY